MQSLIYPTKVMNITQNYNGKTSHYISSHGTPCSFPIDENCGDTNRSYFYAPCDLVVKRIYGVGNNATNNIWLESTNKVKLANGNESYVTISIAHPNDDTLKNIKVGQKFKQYEKMFLEGNDGKATGYHFHIELATCKFSELDNNGWVKNNKGAWVISPNSIKPEQAFLIDKEFTKVNSMGGLKFKYYDKEKISYFKKCDSKIKSLVEGLKSINVDSSFLYRMKIANKNGISIYLGTSKQNIELLKKLSSGKLLIP